MGKDKQPATLTDKKLATKVEGHEIQKPRLLDADHDREISRRNDEALTGYQADAGIKEVTVEKTADVKSASSSSPSADKTATVSEK